MLLAGASQAQFLLQRPCDFDHATATIEFHHPIFLDEDAGLTYWQFILRGGLPLSDRVYASVELPITYSEIDGTVYPMLGNIVAGGSFVLDSLRRCTVTAGITIPTADRNAWKAVLADPWHYYRDVPDAIAILGGLSYRVLRTSTFFFGGEVGTHVYLPYGASILSSPEFTESGAGDTLRTPAVYVSLCATAGWETPRHTVSGGLTTLVYIGDPGTHSRFLNVASISGSIHAGRFSPGFQLAVPVADAVVSTYIRAFINGFVTVRL